MWELIRANRRRSILLVITMAVLLGAMGYAVGHLFLNGDPIAGIALALILWGLLAVVSLQSGDSILLSIAGARKITKADHPTLYNVVEEMTIAAGLPKMPAIYIIDDPAPNAFATGRTPERASVAVTAGLLELLDRDQLQGVVAHELGHVRNRDIQFMTLLAVMAGVIVLLAELGRRMIFFGGVGRSRRRTSSSRGGGGQGAAIIAVVALVLMILAPIVAQLLYLAASRRREYLADASGAIFTRYPEGLASALERIGGSTQRLQRANRATAPLYIVNPLAVSKRGLADITSTHPPLSERIRILRAMAGSGNFGQYDEAFRKVTGRAVGVVPASARGAAAARAPATAAPATSHTQRVRETSDALWRLNGYTFIPCACGTRLKVPRDYHGQSLACPSCGRVHSVTEPQASAG
jgi:heat shock protein HtpX